MPFHHYRRIFMVRSFRLFWIGFTLSALGDAMTRVALTWFVYETTHSAEALGLLMLCYTGPVIVGGLVAGSLLDRFDKRSVMIFDNLIRGIVMAALPLLYGLGQLALWHVYAAACVYGALMMISLAGGPALIPDLVKREELATANALETLSFTLSSVIGPPIAGLVIARWNAPIVVIFDALSYFAFTAALFAVQHESGTVLAARPGQETYNLGHAVRLLLTNPVLLSTTIMYMLCNIGAGILSVWLPILADKMSSRGAELYGLLLGATAVGEVVSALLVGALTLKIALGRLICIAEVLSGISISLLLVNANPAVAAISLALVGFFSAPLTIWAQTLRMMIIPEPLRGRTFALLRTLMQSGSPLGGTLAGAILPLLGIPAMVGLSALLIGLPGAVGYSLKALRTATDTGQ